MGSGRAGKKWANGQWVVGSGQWAVDTRQQTVRSQQKAKKGKVGEDAATTRTGEKIDEYG